MPILKSKYCTVFKVLPSVVIICHELELGMHLCSVIWDELRNGLYSGCLKATDDKKREQNFPRSLVFPQRNMLRPNYTLWVCVPSPSIALPSYGSGTKASFPATQNLWVLEIQEWLEGPPPGEWNHWSCRKLFVWSLFLWKKQEDLGHRVLLV